MVCALFFLAPVGFFVAVYALVLFFLVPVKVVSPKLLLVLVCVCAFFLVPVQCCDLVWVCVWGQY